MRMNSKIKGQLDFNNIVPTDNIKYYVENLFQRWSQDNLPGNPSSFHYNVFLARAEKSNTVSCEIKLKNEMGEEWTEWVEKENSKRAFSHCLKKLSQREIRGGMGSYTERIRDYPPRDMHP